MFEAFLDRAPDAVAERLNRAGFAGVDLSSPERHGVPVNRAVRKAEAISDAAAQISGVKVQDVYTKAFSFMGEFDRLVRTEMGVSTEELLATGRIADIPREIWDKASEVALRDTFSADYTRGRGTFNHLAKFVENLSSTPFVGFLFPFGRFMNNNLAFIMQYSPIALWPTLAKARSKGFFAGDTLESMSKMIVGSSALATLMAYQEQKMELGLQWYQEMSSSGDVVNRENLAPGSFYMLAGHMFSLASRGEQISQDLYRNLWDQLGIARITRDLTTNPLDETIDYALSIFDQEAERQEFVGFLQELAKFTLADVGSGFTRPFEPLNVGVGVARGTDTLVDRRQLKGWDAVTKGALRYVDNLFNPLLGDNYDGQGRSTIGPAQQSATQMGPQREANPVARMFGDRVEQPISDIEKALAAVNIAKWTVQERTGLPEWDALMNNKVTPMLNRRAKSLMETDEWKRGNQRTRERMVRSMLQTVKTEIRNWIMETGTDDDRLLAERRRYLSLPESLRAQAKSALRIDKPDDELTILHIEMLKQYISDRRSLEREMIDLR
jgi:hypothetical protein